MKFAVRLGVSPAAATPTGFYRQTFWGFFPPCKNPGLCGLSRSPVVLSSYLHANGGPPSLPPAALPAGTSSHSLSMHPVRPSCPSPPLLPVWMNVSSLNPWLWDFYIVRFSGSSGFFVFKFFLVLLLVMQGGTVCLPMPPSWPKSKAFLSWPILICGWWWAVNHELQRKLSGHLKKTKHTKHTSSKWQITQYRILNTKYTGRSGWL